VSSVPQPEARGLVFSAALLTMTSLCLATIELAR
jgi:hypothetical protein